MALVLKAQEMDSCLSSEVLKTPPTHQAHTQICSRGHDPITANSSEISGTSPCLWASILKPHDWQGCAHRGHTGISHFWGTNSKSKVQCPDHAFTLNTCSIEMPTCLVTRNQGLLKPQTVT